jgi:cytosine/adenosine deaminase-related metal-dependent hydrolase
VTTVVHHDTWEHDFELDFPVRVARLRCVHSPGFDAAGMNAAAAAGMNAAAAAGAGGTPLTIHVAEGTNGAAADEVRTLHRAGLLDSSLFAVHVVGVDDDGVDRLHAAGAAVVWCPTSNLYLFGRTAPPRLLACGDVLLGTDALLTSAGTMLDELRVARALGCVDDDRLRAAVGSSAARRLGLGPFTLEAGGAADLLLLRRPLLAASALDVALVIVAGVPRFSAAEFAPFFQRAGVRTGEITVCGMTRLVSRPLASTAQRVLREWPECGRIFHAAGVGDVTPLVDAPVVLQQR